MQRSNEFQFLIGNHLHNSLLAAIEENNNTDISIIKNNRIVTTISKSKANDLAKAIIALNDNYGDKVVGVILHGSYAVNKAREDSNIDVFVLVKEKMQQSDLWKFKALLADSIDIHFSTVDYFWNVNSTIHQNIMRKGLLLWVS